MIPLIMKIKKAAHKEIAQGQDILIKEVYEHFPDAVLHGGTAIWRCYNGLRFSEDIDLYIPLDKEKIDAFFAAVEKKGFRILKKRIREKSLYSTLQWNRMEIRFEALFLTKTGVLKEYETAESNYLPIYTLSAEELIKEKTEAYLNRKKIRDLYDLFFLLQYVEEKKKIKQYLKKLIEHFKQPVDPQELRIFILEGVVPSAHAMYEHIKKMI